MAYTKHLWTTNKETSARFNAATANEMEQGIFDAHLMTAPVDCTSRVAEYTGDGIPLIPDNVAGAAFIRDNNWSSVTPFTVEGSTASYVSGKLVLTATSLYPQINTNVTPYVGKYLIAKVRKISGTATFFGINVGGTTVSQSSFATIQSVTITHFISPSSTGPMALVFAGATVGDTYEIEALYIGTGAYDTPALDRSGNGNSLTLNAVTPVNGKYCKEMSFNGTTSYAQASSPVIGATGTVAVRFKLNAATAGDIASNANSDGLNGFRIRVGPGGVLNAFIAGSSAYQNISLGTIGTTLYNTVILSWDGTTITKTIAGVTTTESQTVEMTSALNNLTLGRYAQVTGNYLNGIISHFRYDSRIWTADEARAWSLNPISIDSRVA